MDCPWCLLQSSTSSAAPAAAAAAAAGLVVLIFMSGVLRSAAKRNRLKGGTFQTLNLCIAVSSVLTLVSFFPALPLCIAPCLTLPISVWGYARGLRQAGGNAIKFSPLIRRSAPWLSALYWILTFFCLVISLLHMVLGEWIAAGERPDRSIDRSTDRPTDRPTNQPTNQLIVPACCFAFRPRSHHASSRGHALHSQARV